MKGASMKLRIVQVILTSILLCFSTVQGGSAATSIDSLQKAAEQGDVDAQTQLGNYYYLSKEPDRNYIEAIKWFERAASSGDTCAQYRMGDCYSYGRGTTKDYAKAMEWYRKAANNKNGEISWRQDGYFKLGAAYLCGLGVEHDEEKAEMYFAKSAENSLPVRKYGIGRMYLLKPCLNRDKAIKWLSQSYSEGYTNAYDVLVKTCIESADLLYEQKAYPESLERYRQAAILGDKTAQMKTAEIYYYSEHRTEGRTDDDIQADEIEAFKWFLMGAENGEGYCQYMAGNYFCEGKYVPIDYTKAYDWYSKSAEQGYYAAFKKLGDLYFWGNGVPQDTTTAENWYGKAAEESTGYQAFKIAKSPYLLRSKREDVIRWLEISSQKGYKEAEELLKQVREYQIAPALQPDHFENISMLNLSLDDFKSAQSKALANLQSQPGGFYNLYVDFFARVYATLKSNGFMVLSHRPKKEVPGTCDNNYAVLLETLLQRTLSKPPSVEQGVAAKLNNGSTVNIVKISPLADSSVFVKDGDRLKQIPLRELTSNDQNLVQSWIIDRNFGSKLEVSIDDIQNKTARETDSRRQYRITLKNSSDMPITHLILEYQIFFNQTLAGTLKNSEDNFRLVGFSTIQEIPSHQNTSILVAAPFIHDIPIQYMSLGKFARQSDGSWNKDSFYAYPAGCNQASSGKIRGIWIRIHRITPYGLLTREIKEGLLPRSAEWCGISELEPGFVQILLDGSDVTTRQMGFPD